MLSQFRAVGLLKLVLLMGALVAGLRDAPAAERLPNIVFIISDDQAWTDFGFMGHETIQTPNLDRLAAESATFPNGYVPDSLCRPSLATMVTGLYPHQHKISGNDPASPDGRKTWAIRNDPNYQKKKEQLIANLDDCHPLPKLLAKKGYLSHQSGKWWEGHYSRGGFTHGMTHGDPKRGGRHGDVGLKIGREGMQPIFDFIEEAGEEPFFIWYAPFLPHSPHNPPKRLLEKYTAPGKSIHVARYQAMCEWFDETCGQLIDHIDNKGLGEETIFMFVTDNGWIQQEKSPKYAEKSKRSQYDGGLRTPIMIRWTGHIEPKTYPDLVSSIDMVPTVLAAAGIEAPQPLPGENLLPLVQEGKPLERDTIYGAIFDHDVADIEVPAASLHYRWARQGDWKLILPHAKDTPVELFNLKDDPFETKNLAAEKPELVKELTAKIEGWYAP